MMYMKELARWFWCCIACVQAIAACQTISIEADMESVPPEVAQLLEAENQKDLARCQFQGRTMDIGVDRTAWVHVVTTKEA